MQNRIIGKNVLRTEGKSKVCGTAKYINDIDFSDEVFITLVTAGIPHGILDSINVSEAKGIYGVEAVFTAKDIPEENQMGEVIEDYPILIDIGEKIRFTGDFIAIVAAKSKEIADYAAKKVSFEIRALPPVLSIEEALKDENRLYEGSNVKVHQVVKKGITDPEKMFADCERIIERNFFADYQEHAYLETQGCIALLDHNNDMTIYGSMQCPYYVQNAVAKAINFPFSKVRVIQMETGGAFGGKEDVPSYFAVPTAITSFLLKKPAKLILSREEDIQITSKRHPIKSHYKVGFDNNGKIKAVQVEAFGDMGAHGTLSPIVLWRSAVHAAGAYDICNVSVNVFGVYTNKVPSGAYRGFGSPQVFFAIESIVDEIAEILHLDRLEIRKMNCLKKGLLTPTGHLIEEEVGAFETIWEAERISEWKSLNEEVIKFNERNKYKKRGIGVSHIHYGVALGAMGQRLDASGAFVQIFKDGTVGVQIGGTEIGQGAKTVMAQIASEILGVDYEKVFIFQPDTSYVPDSGPTVASRTTIFSGNAVKDACERLLMKTKNIFSEEFRIPVDEILVNSGFYTDKKELFKMTFEEIAFKGETENKGLSETGWFETPKLTWDSEKGFGQAYITYAFATNIILIELNTLTAEISVLKAFSSNDTGTAINPEAVKGQIHGGFAQGMGYALYEKIKINEKGRIVTDNFNTLTIPTIHEMPEVFKISLVETPFSKGPFGAKGIGEPSLIPTPAAIANAVSDALKERVTVIPITKEEIFAVLSKKNGGCSRD